MEKVVDAISGDDVDAKRSGGRLTMSFPEFGSYRLIWISGTHKQERGCNENRDSISSGGNIAFGVVG